MTVSQGMTYAHAAALVALSARAALAPRGAALAYGVPIPEGTAPTPYLEVKASRDFVLACLLVVTASVSHSVRAFALFVGAIAPAPDAWIVSRHGKITGTAVHLGTVAYLGVAGALPLRGTDMFLATVPLCHVLAAIGVGPIFTLPLLANAPAALHAVLVLLRFGAGATLLSGILLWVELKPVHPSGFTANAVSE